MTTLVIKEIKEFAHGYFGLGSMIVFILLLYAFLWIFPQSSYIYYGFTDPQLYFSMVAYLCLLIVPLLSVGMIAREYSLGTFEILKSQRLSWTAIVVAKFVAVMSYVIVLILLTLVHLYVLQQLSMEGSIGGMGQMVGSIFGVILIAASYAAIALCIAAWLEHATWAIIVSITVCFVLYIGLSFVSDIQGYDQIWGYTITNLSLQWHADQLSKGILHLKTIAYVISICLVGLYGAVSFLNHKNF